MLENVALYDQECSCESFNSCKWSKDEIQKIIETSANSASIKTRIKYVQERICDAKTKSVYCCTNGQAPIDHKHLAILKGDAQNPKTNSSETENKVCKNS